MRWCIQRLPAAWLAAMQKMRRSWAVAHSKKAQDCGRGDVEGLGDGRGCLRGGDLRSAAIRRTFT
jgi:hypothetical protein